MVFMNMNEITITIVNIMAQTFNCFRLKTVDNGIRSTITRYIRPAIMNPPTAPRPCNIRIAAFFSSVRGNERSSGTSDRLRSVVNIDMNNPRNCPINIPAKKIKTRIINEYQGLGGSLYSGFLEVISIIGVNLHF